MRLLARLSWEGESGTFIHYEGLHGELFPVGTLPKEGNGHVVFSEFTVGDLGDQMSLSSLFAEPDAKKYLEGTLAWLNFVVAPFLEQHQEWLQPQPLPQLP
ncbi:MAG: hypothetical protein C5B49_16635 [Bdellovibrio sp.]|nr:MAG: hypothetical protein C5B49_16635 [Bdellovibrio sp.]